MISMPKGNNYKWASEWLLFNAKWKILQLHVYHVENKLYFDEIMMMMMISAELVFYSNS